MAQIDIGKLSFTHKGDYSSSTAYVLNDVVYYNGSAYIAKQSTTNNVPTNATYWSNFTAGSGGIWNSGLSLGSAGEIVQVNSGANALEFATAPSGVVKKIHHFSKSNRVTHNSSADTNVFTWTSSFTPLDPVNNLMHVSSIVPGNAAGQNFSGFGPRFTHTNGTNYDFNGYGSMHVDSSQMCHQSNIFIIPAGTLAAGTYTIYHRHYSTNSQMDAYFPNSSDDNRLNQTRGDFIIQEYKNS